MATRSTSIFVEEPGIATALNQALQTCPEVLSSIYTTHYPQVLQVCRRFFRRPEDAEDAAAEVFLKLHTVLEKKDEEHPFRPWVCQVAGRHCIDKLRRRNTRNARSWLEMIFASSPTLPLLLLSPKFCTRKQNAR